MGRGQEWTDQGERAALARLQRERPLVIIDRRSEQASASGVDRGRQVDRGRPGDRPGQHVKINRH